MILSDGEVRAMSALALAHMGDAVYEILARREVCRSGKLTAGELHRQTIRYVSAPAQARAAEKIRPHLTGEEEAVYRRGARAQPCRTPRRDGGRVPRRFRAGGAVRVALSPRTKRADRRTLCYHFGGKQCLWTPYC